MQSHGTFFVTQSNTVTVNSSKAEDREDEVSFFVYAQEFIYAAEMLYQSPNRNAVATASYYLYGHGLELCYKAYLYKCGIGLRELKKEIGHDLGLALRKSKEFGVERYLQIDSEYESIVHGVNKYYSTKELEYMSKTFKSFPLLEEVKGVAKRTASAVFDAVNGFL